MTSAKDIIIGTRGSELALAQAFEVKNLISDYLKNSQNFHLNQNSEISYLKNSENSQDLNPSNYPNFISENCKIIYDSQYSDNLQNSCKLQIQAFKTTGDRILNKSLSEIGGKSLFTKEIEEALIENRITLAVHSMKDMSAIPPHNLDNLIVIKREDPRDAFVSLKYKSIEELPQNSVVGTSSTRRKALILAIRPDLKIVDLRGNVNTRLEKLNRNEVDATILAVSGLKRINKENYIQSIIPASTMLPAVGQGAIVVQCRNDDKFSCDLISKINHFETDICVKAERAFLREIEGSCQTPIAGYCEIKDNSLFLRVLVASPDGSEIYQASRIGSFEDTLKIGQDIGHEIKKNAKHILDLICLKKKN